MPSTQPLKLNQPAAPTQTAHCFIGTCGWIAPAFAHGVLYPDRLPQSRWLEFYATQFNSVEINSSFYRIPSPSMIDRWRTVTPPDYPIALKLWRGITHLKRLRNCTEQIQQFLNAVGGLGPKFSALLVQLPPNLPKDLPRLDNFLTELRALLPIPHTPRLAVEFRHPTWLYDDAVYQLMDHHSAAIVLEDWPTCPITRPNNAPFVYIRRHGTAGRYVGSYPHAKLTHDAQHISQWLHDRRDVYVYFNNTATRSAIDNARSLSALIAPHP